MIPAIDEYATQSQRVADAIALLCEIEEGLRDAMKAKGYDKPSASIVNGSFGIHPYGIISDIRSKWVKGYGEALSYIDALPQFGPLPVSLIEATLGVGPSSPPNPFLEGERNRDTQS